MARETLRDFLSSIGLSADSISYNVRDDNSDGRTSIGDDLGVDPNTGKELLDLSDHEKGLLGDYLNFIQENSDVIFNVSPGNTQSISAVKGDPLPAADLQGADKVFVEMSTSSPQSLGLLEYSNSGKFDETSANLNEHIDKTSGEDGHYLLNRVEGDDIDTSGKLSVGNIIEYPDTPSGIKQKRLINSSVEILRNNNRFSPAGDTSGDAFVERGKVDEQLESEPTLGVHREFGKYDKESYKTSLDSISRIGESLLSVAIGQDGEITRISQEDLRSRNAEGFPNTGGEEPESLRAGRGDFVTLTPTESSLSFGSMNSPERGMQFDSNNTKMLKSRAIVAIKSALKAIDTFKNTIIDVSGGPNSRVDTARGPFKMGENAHYIESSMSIIMNTILVPTKDSYENCVNEGARLMFNLDGNLSSINYGGINNSKIKKSKIVKTSPGFSLVLARSIILSVHTLSSAFSEQTSENEMSDSLKNIKKIGESRIVGILNTLAIIGDIKLGLDTAASGDFGFLKTKGGWDVDELPDGPATRVSKSRTSDGHNASALSMRTSATPSAYVLPVGVLRAVSRLGMSSTDSNPGRLLASTMGDKIYTGASISEGGRIPGSVVKRLEDILDSEYVPFYFHDIRTNEIISFHAFLDTLSDGYTANFSESKGYGRLDAVQTYSDTKRDIGFSFTIAATSPEDFDEMWFKINKLTTMVYPQWTKGDFVSSGDGDAKFIQPFSQIIGSSPLIRLRIGDVIKGNYSKFNLGRIFGAGEKDADLKPPKKGLFGALPSMGSLGGLLGFSLDEFFLQAFLVVFGSPMDLLQGGGLFGNVGFGGVPGALSAIEAGASKMLKNGFANPILQLVTRQYIDPDSDPSETVATKGNKSANASAALQSKITDNKIGYVSRGKTAMFGKKVFIKPSMARSYEVVGKDGESFSPPKKIRFNRPVKGIVVDRVSPSGHGTLYKVKIIDYNVPTGFFGATMRVTHSDIHHDPADSFARVMMPVLNPFGFAKAVLQDAANAGASMAGIDASSLGLLLSESRKFLGSDTNSITRGFESTRGRGLAGVMTSLKFDWISENTTWETDWGSRAPIFCKVNVGFTPIHDIPPGLDSEGFNRAPIYNVGNLSRTVAGDPYDDGGQSSRETYDFEHRKTFKND